MPLGFVVAGVKKARRGAICSKKSGRTTRAQEIHGTVLRAHMRIKQELSAPHREPGAIARLSLDPRRLDLHAELELTEAFASPA